MPGHRSTCSRSPEVDFLAGLLPGHPSALLENPEREAEVRFARRNATANSSNSSNASPTPQPHVDWAQNKEYE